MTTSHPGEVVEELGSRCLEGAKIALINMPLRESAKPNTPPQGPGLMAARLREYGATPFIIDLNAYRITDAASKEPNGRHISFSETEALIASTFGKFGEPDMIGLSGMITTLRWQEAVAGICRKLAKNSFIVSGGGLATEIKDGLFEWIPELDAIGRSEGDDIILLMAKDAMDIRNGKPLPGSPFWRRTIDAGSKPKYAYEGNRPKNLDKLPFAALDLLEEDVNGKRILEDYITTPVWGLAANNSSATPFEMKRSLTTVSSRGCPYECSFCYRGAQGERNWGMRSPESLAQEAKWLIEKYRIDFLGFPDDNFAVRKDRIAQLPKAFEGLDIRWGTHTRMDEADERALDMAKSGCVYIGFGAESASENTLNRMNKGGFILSRGISEIGGFRFPKTMVDAVHNCKEFGIHSNCTWIMGYPGETLDDLKTSVAFILWQIEQASRGTLAGTRQRELAVASINQKMFTATAYPGTAMFKESKVKKAFEDHCGISFDGSGNPICDRAFRDYVLELDDATKVITGSDGKPLNYGEMPDDRFMEARDCVDSGRIEKILDM